MFSPCAPIGGTTCAASAISASRSPAMRSAICAIIGQTMRRPTSVSGPRIRQDRALAAAAKSASARPARRATSGPRSIQTTAEQGSPSRSGSGTSVNGPPERWISVETLRCGSLWVTTNDSAFWP